MADLDLTQLAENQSRPDITTNDVAEELAKAVSSKHDCDLTSGNVSVTADDYRRAITFRAINVATTGRTVTLPLVEREFVLVECDSANTNTVGLIRGSTTIVLTPGRLYVVRTDGTTNGLVARDIGGVNEPFDAHVFLPSTMTNSQVLLRLKAVRAFTLPISLTGSFVTAGTAATASTTITLKKNGSSIGTAVFAIAGVTATLTFSSAVSFAIGDVLSIHAPASADATLADTAIDLLGTR